MTKQYHFASETLSALQNNHTIRIVLKAKYNLESRHSSRAIEWATSKVAPHVAGALLKEINQDEKAFECHVKLISLLRGKPRAYICFDVFLNTCDEAKRDEKNKSAHEPIHYMFYESADYYSRRAPNLDVYTMKNLENCRMFDHGPEPYFSDLQNPPVYMNGVRREKPEHVRDEDWDGYGILGRHIDDLGYESRETE